MAGWRCWGAGAGGCEQQAYEAALALTRERKHEEAIAAFRAVLVDYPAGTLTANAFYWLGENYLALAEPQLEQARQAFAQVVNLFPDHGKVPDALYKLGVVHDRLGSAAWAREYLQQVINEHDGSAAARLATSYLAQMR